MKLFAALAAVLLLSANSHAGALYTADLSTGNFPLNAIGSPAFDDQSWTNPFTATVYIKGYSYFIGLSGLHADADMAFNLVLYHTNGQIQTIAQIGWDRYASPTSAEGNPQWFGGDSFAMEPGAYVLMQAGVNPWNRGTQGAAHGQALFRALLYYSATP